MAQWRNSGLVVVTMVTYIRRDFRAEDTVQSADEAPDLYLE